MCCKNDDFSRRVGRIEVSNKLIYQSPRNLMEVLREVLVLEVNCHHYRDTTEFIGFSENFDVIEEGEKVPTYIVECTEIDNVKSYLFKRVR